MTRQESHELWKKSNKIFEEHVEQLKTSTPEVTVVCNGNFGDLAKVYDEHKDRLHELWVDAYKDAKLEPKECASVCPSLEQRNN